MKSSSAISDYNLYPTLSTSKAGQMRIIEDLMVPRFILTNPYPNCEFKEGQVIKPVTLMRIETYRKCDANFTELKWHENRTAEELPKFVKSKKLNMVLKLTALSGKVATLEDHTGSTCDLFIKDFTPAAEFEFDEYVKRTTGAK